VTPYYREPLEFLSQAHESVRAQSYPCRHIMVADGSPNPALAGWDVEHISLSGWSNDFGSTPRFVGAAHAVFQGFDIVAFLDADNWYREDHVQAVVELVAGAGAAFVSSGRMLCRLDGSVMRECPTTHPDRFIDTSCMAFARAGFPLLTRWVTLPSYAHAMGDRCVHQSVMLSGAPRAHSAAPTVFYRCGKAGIYGLLGEPVPAGVAPAPDYGALFQRWVNEGRPPLV
jgi:hypothetical protein